MFIIMGDVTMPFAFRLSAIIKVDFLKQESFEKGCGQDFQSSIEFTWNARCKSQNEAGSNPLVIYKK